MITLFHEWIAASDSHHFHILSYGLRNFAKPEVPLQNDTSKNIDVSVIEQIDDGISIILWSHFWLFKALKPERQLLETTTNAYSPSFHKSHQNKQNISVVISQKHIIKFHGYLDRFAKLLLALLHVALQASITAWKPSRRLMDIDDWNGIDFWGTELVDFAHHYMLRRKIPLRWKLVGFHDKYYKIIYF